MVSVSHQQEHLSVRVSSAGAGAALILQAPELYSFRHDLCQEFNNMQILLDLVNHIVYISLFIKFD